MAQLTAAEQQQLQQMTQQLLQAQQTLNQMQAQQAASQPKPASTSSSSSPSSSSSQPSYTPSQSSSGSSYTTTPTQGPALSMSSWSSDQYGRFINKPVITYNGQQYTFNTASEYIAFLNGFKNTQNSSQIDNLVNQLRPVDDKFKQTGGNAQQQPNMTNQYPDRYSYYMTLDQLKSYADQGQFSPDVTQQINNLYGQYQGSTGSTYTTIYTQKPISGANPTYTPPNQPQQQPTQPTTPQTDPNQNIPGIDGGMGQGDGSIGGTPYFMGQMALLKFSGNGPNGAMNQNTIWLLDPSTRTLRPFSSPDALTNFFGRPINPQEIQTLSAAELLPGGLLGAQNGQGGFEMLGSQYAIQPDGTAKAIDYNASQLMTRYGSPINKAAEEQASMLVDQFLDSLSKTNSGVNQDSINALRGDKTRMAFYLNAVAYGGYSLSDMYRDIKGRELGIDSKPISASSNKSDYIKTDMGRSGSQDSRTQPPAQIGAFDSTNLKLSLYDIPEEAFKTLIDILNPDSEEFKRRMNEIETSYYDILVTQLNAGTEQEKAVADYQWEQFREELSKNYGIQLSNNALDAWNQIEGMYDQFANRNTFGSGMMNESIDEYLRRVRRGDQQLRDEKMTKEETEKMNYYIKFATPAQIKELADSNPELAKKWGLIPSDEVKGELSFEALKAKYPTAKDEDLHRYIASVIDENGNYRSGLYQRQLTQQNEILFGEGGKEDYQKLQAYNKSLREEEKAYSEFTTPDIAFLRATDKTDPNQTQYVPTDPNAATTVNLADQIKQARFGLDQNFQSGYAPSNPNQGAINSMGNLSGLQNELQNLQGSTRGFQPTAPTSVTGFNSGNIGVKTPTTTPTSTQPINWNAYQPANQSTPTGPVYKAPPTTSSQSPLGGQSLLSSSSLNKSVLNQPSTQASTSGSSLWSNIKQGASNLYNKFF